MARAPVVLVAIAAAAVVWVSGCGDGFQPLGTPDGGDDGGGQGFTTVFDNPDGGALHAIWGSGPNDVHVVGDDGVILDWDGDKWYRVMVGAGEDLWSVWGSGPYDMWAVGESRASGKGVLYHRLQAPVWTQYGTTTLGLRSVWGLGDLRYAVGVQGAIYSGNAAAPFATGIQAGPNPMVPNGPDSPINWQISGNSPSSILIAADVDTVFFYDGTQWHTYDDPIDRTRTYVASFALPGPSVDFYWGANYFGLWHFTGKLDPTIQLHEEKDTSDKQDKFLRGIWAPDQDHVIAVGDDGKMITLYVPTQAVTVQPPPTTRSLNAIWGTSLDDVYLAGEGGLVLHGRISGF